MRWSLESAALAVRDRLQFGAAHLPRRTHARAPAPRYSGAVPTHSQVHEGECFAYLYADGSKGDTLVRGTKRGVFVDHVAGS